MSSRRKIKVKKGKGGGWANFLGCGMPSENCGVCGNNIVKEFEEEHEFKWMSEEFTNYFSLAVKSSVKQAEAEGIPGYDAAMIDYFCEKCRALRGSLAAYTISFINLETEFGEEEGKQIRAELRKQAKKSLAKDAKALDFSRFRAELTHKEGSC